MTSMQSIPVVNLILKSLRLTFCSIKNEMIKLERIRKKYKVELFPENAIY